MSLLEKIPALREMVRAATPPHWSPTPSFKHILGGNELNRIVGHEGGNECDVELIYSLRNAAPAMLSVLECFREGDAKTMRTIGCSDWSDEQWTLIERLQKAAELMEAKGGEL